MRSTLRDIVSVAALGVFTFTPVIVFILALTRFAGTVRGTLILAATTGISILTTRVCGVAVVLSGTGTISGGLTTAGVTPLTITLTTYGSIALARFSRTAARLLSGLLSASEGQSYVPFPWTCGPNVDKFNKNTEMYIKIIKCLNIC